MQKHMHWHAVNKWLHWLMVVLILAAIVLGWSAVSWDNAVYPLQSRLYSWHKSVGLTVLVLGLLRIAWRFIYPRPAPLSSHQRWERRVAEVVHILLYGLLLLLPLSGWLLHSAAELKSPLTWFGWFGVPDLISQDAALQALASQVHEALFWVLAGLLILHITGALKHHWVDGDLTLQRLLPRWQGGWVLYPVLGCVLLAIAIPLTVQLTMQWTQWSMRFAASDASASDVSLAPNAQGVDERVVHSETLLPNWQLQADAVNTLSFDVTVLNETVYGQFNAFEVSLRFHPERLEDSWVRATIDPADVDSGSRSRDELLPNSDWFWVEQHPQAEFYADEFEPHLTKPFMYVAIGQLTLRGVTQPLRLPFHWQAASESEVMVVTANVTLNRLDYAVGAEVWPNAEDISHEVTVTLHLQFVARP